MRVSKGVLLALGALAAAAPAQAQIMGLSSRQLEKGSLRMLAYYQGTSGQDLNFTVQNPGGCTTKVVGGVRFACGQTGDVGAAGSGGMGVLKLLYQPGDLIQYYILGGIGDYSLRAPFNGVTQSLTGDHPGWMAGGGLRVVVIPDTLVTPGIAVDLGGSQSAYKFNRRSPGSGVPGENNNINQRLGLTQWQFALQLGHLFTITEPQDAVERDQQILIRDGFKIEPYGGVKMTLIQADLHDLQDGSHAAGHQDGISPFIGVRLPFYKREGLFAEISFVHGTQFAGGLEFRF